MCTMQDDIENTQRGILVRTLSSWRDFIKLMKDPRESPGTLIYRGQGNANWKVTSTLDRLEKAFPRKPNLAGQNPEYFDVPPVHRELQLRRFMEMARGRLASQIPTAGEDEWWALAQHHGMATPMLDWTYSPFVALYFAFEQEKCTYRAPAQRAVFALAHYVLSGEKPGPNGKDVQCPKPFAPNWPGNYRLTNQAGLFVKMPQGVDLETYVRTQFVADTYAGPGDRGEGNLHPRAVLQKYAIPNTRKERFECLRFLDLMNINRASLFPDLDGSARYVNDLWGVNFDKAIGYVNRQDEGR
jgi:hypothetical protein